MDLFEISAVLLTACAFGSFVNYKWMKLPSSIGLLLLAIGVGLLGILLKKINLIDTSFIKTFLSHINFKETIFHGMLSFLLFAGALQIDLKDLQKTKLPIAILATVSTFISTIIIGVAFYLLANRLGFTQVTLLYAMLFGAILSPTDPIAALSIIKKMNASKKIETTIIGESLFNDGIAIVFFLTILALITATGETTVSSVTALLFQQIIGGILFGGVIGWIAYQMLQRIDAYQVELFITLAVATGGYTLAEKLNVSGPLAMVVAGIIIGHQARLHSMSAQTKKYVDSFWEATDDIFNTVLFFLIGLEMIIVDATSTLIILSAACIVIALAARFISIAIPLTLLKPFYSSKRGTIIILTWGGLRGALSIAMVLSLQKENIIEIFLPCIYFVVIFSIAVQGLTLSKILKLYQMEFKKSDIKA